LISLLCREHTWKISALHKRNTTPSSDRKKKIGTCKSREHGVGFAVKNAFLRIIEQHRTFLSLHLHTTGGPIPLARIYAPNLAEPAGDNQFCENPTSLVNRILAMISSSR
jgi:hypothetical protein